MKKTVLFAPFLAARKSYGSEFGSGDEGLSVRLGNFIDSPLCPSEFNGNEDSGCYVQNDDWTPGADITCSMMNKACLKVECSVSGISATLSAKLFHTNLEDTRSFAAQLQAGARKMKVNNKEVKEDENCGYTVDGDDVVLNWNYAECEVSPTLVGNDIHYSLFVSSDGNSGDDSDVIEFYVDTDIDATCSYPTRYAINATGFHINQEDVNAASKEIGDLSELFDCSFYDSNKVKERNLIGKDNIVNMGEMIFGEVSTTAAGGYGLSYRLESVKVSSGDKDFYVIENHKSTKLVKAKRQNKKEITKPLRFRYMSFGFEDETDQNFLDIECGIKVFIDNGAGLGRMAGRQPPFMGVQEDDYYDYSDIEGY